MRSKQSARRVGRRELDGSASGRCDPQVARRLCARALNQLMTLTPRDLRVVLFIFVLHTLHSLVPNVHAHHAPALAL